MQESRITSELYLTGLYSYIHLLYLICVINVTLFWQCLINIGTGKMCPFPVIQVSMAASVSPGHNWRWHPSHQPIRRSTSTHDPSLVAINGQEIQRWWTGKSQQIRILPFRTTLLNYEGEISSSLARTVDPRGKLRVICYDRNLHIKVLEVYFPLSMVLRKPEALLVCHFKVTWNFLFESCCHYLTIDCSSFFITCSSLSSYLSELSLSIQILEADCSRSTTCPVLQDL